MIAKIFVSPNLKVRGGEIENILEQAGLTKNHPDLLFFDDQEKLGVEQAKQIRSHLSLKPYSAKGRAVAIISAHNLTPDAQNALLKTLEEPPEEAVFVLGTDKESSLLPTILSRCQLKRLANKSSESNQTNFQDDINKLLGTPIEQRFEYIEKLEEKEQFLKALVAYFHSRLIQSAGKNDTAFAKKLIKAEQWADANGNIRAILEYLMLNLLKSG